MAFKRVTSKPSKIIKVENIRTITKIFTIDVNDKVVIIILGEQIT